MPDFKVGLEVRLKESKAEGTVCAVKRNAATQEAMDVKIRFKESARELWFPPEMLEEVS